MVSLLTYLLADILIEIGYNCIVFGSFKKKLYAFKKNALQSLITVINCVFATSYYFKPGIVFKGEKL